MKKISLLLILLYLSLANVVAQLYIRYNQKGYHLAQKKELIILSTSNSTNETWTFKKDNQLILDGKLGSSIAGKGAYVPTDFSYLIDFSSIQEAGNYTFSIKGQNVQIKIQDYIYQDLAQEILRTFRVRRSGSSDALDHSLSHTGDNLCHVYERSGTNNQKWIKSTTIADVDMLGGWYDAGDYIKFTLTTAYSAYFLLKAHETAPELFTSKEFSKTSYTDLLDEAKHGLDYLMKTFPNENTFIIQVGGYQDHELGNRLPENDILNGYREAYHSFSRTHMGYTAAALALGARQFLSINPSLSEQYKQKAIAIFNKAESSTAVDYAYFEGNGTSPTAPKLKNGVISPTPNTGGTGYATFYADNSPNDNMALAAIELYQLTNDISYLNKAKTYANLANAAYWKAWSNVNMNVHNALLDENTKSLNSLKTDLNVFNKIATNANNIWHVPHETTWGSNYSYIGVANSIAEYHISKNDATYFPLFVNVIDFILGKNNWGMSMLASKKMPVTASNNYATIYKIQNLFPTGEVAEGPTTQQELINNGFSNATSPESPFNTSAMAFFNDKNNYVTMESTISGQADAFYLFTLASKILSTTPLVTEQENTKKARITIYPNPVTNSFTVNLPENGNGTISIYNITGKLVYENSFENQESLVIKNSFKKGNYLVKVLLNESSLIEKIVIE